MALTTNALRKVAGASIRTARVGVNQMILELMTFMQENGHTAADEQIAKAIIAINTGFEALEKIFETGA